MAAVVDLQAAALELLQDAVVLALESQQEALSFELSPAWSERAATASTARQTIIFFMYFIDCTTETGALSCSACLTLPAFKSTRMADWQCPLKEGGG